LDDDGDAETGGVVDDPLEVVEVLGIAGDRVGYRAPQLG
jgi:hypothetical protein